MRTFVKHVLCLALIVSSAAAFAGRAANEPTEADHLQVLAGQTFRMLHSQYVTLPDGSTWRIARSTKGVPFGWPEGELIGLLREEYVRQAFAGSSLAALDAGTVLLFHIPDLDVDVALFLRRSERTGTIGVKGTLASDDVGVIGIGILGCGDDDNISCACGGSTCDSSCVDGDTTVWTANGEETEEGNAVFENENGQTAENCGGSEIGITLAPL